MSQAALSRKFWPSPSRGSDASVNPLGLQMRQSRQGKNPVESQFLAKVPEAKRAEARSAAMSAKSFRLMFPGSHARKQSGRIPVNAAWICNLYVEFLGNRDSVGWQSLAAAVMTCDIVVHS